MSNLIKVEILEDTLKDTIAGIAITLHKGDQVSVDREIAKYWCRLGWAKDIKGKIKTGERIPGASGEIVPDAIVQTMS